MIGDSLSESLMTHRHQNDQLRDWLYINGE
jgi:hypothetical protein